MEIKIDLELLEEHIELCDLYAAHAGNDYTAGMFEGMANFLSTLHWALENGHEIKFKITKES